MNSFMEECRGSIMNVPGCDGTINDHPKSEAQKHQTRKNLTWLGGGWGGGDYYRPGRVTSRALAHKTSVRLAQRSLNDRYAEEPSILRGTAKREQWWRTSSKRFREDGASSTVQAAAIRCASGSAAHVLFCSCRNKDFKVRSVEDDASVLAIDASPKECG